MTKDEVKYYFDNRSNRAVAIEFAMRYTTEVKGFDWNPAFASLVDGRVFSFCFDEMRRELNIVLVEEISTGRIIALL